MAKDLFAISDLNGRFIAVIPCEGGLAYWMARRLSAQRIFERRYGTSYKWCIRSEHINVPREIRAELPVTDFHSAWKADACEQIQQFVGNCA